MSMSRKQYPHARDSRQFPPTGETYFFSPPVSSLYSDPEKTFLPLGNLILVALATLAASLAKNASTVTWSPCLSEFFVQPLCINMFGLPSSNSQLAILPSASFTSI